MRKILTYTLLCLLMAMGFSCKQKPTNTDISDTTRLEQLDHLLDKKPNNVDYLYERANILMRLHRNSEAALDIDKAVSLDSKNSDLRILQADIYLTLGNIEKSYQALSVAEQISPESTDIHLKMGEIMVYSKDYDRALDNLSKVTATDPTNRTALFMKGCIYREKNDTSNAVGFFRKVCDLYPDYALAFEELGIIYANRLNPLAKEYLSTAIRLDPNNTNTLYALAMFYQETNDFEQAEALYHNLLDINNNSADALHNLGYIELNHYHDYDRAIDYFTKALVADPHNINSLVNRGLAYEISNKRTLAHNDYQKALSIDSKFQPAIDGFERTR